MTRVFKYLTVFLCYFTAHAQTDETEIRTVVSSMFDGMRSSNAALLKNAFAPTAVLQTVAKSKDGLIKVMTEPVDSFIASVTRPHAGVYDERITFEAIHIDGELAAVWTPYKFYIDDRFLHCGTNSFQLVKLNGSWKIQYIIDTRRRDGCE